MTFLKGILIALLMVSVIAIAGCTVGETEPFPSPHGLLDTSTNKTVLMLFWGDGCPHCAKEIPFLKKMAAKYPQLEIRSAEVWGDQANSNLYTQLAKAYGQPVKGVPGTFIGDQLIVGYDTDADTGAQIETAIQQCITDGNCTNPASRLPH